MTDTARRIQSDPDVCGFPGQMLGAYLAGLVATGAASCVMLKRPVAGGNELRVDGTDVHCDDEVVATVEEWDPADIAVPPVVTPDEVTGVAVVDPGNHPVPRCYVCGPSGTGLRLDFRVPAGRAGLPRILGAAARRTGRHPCRLRTAARRRPPAGALCAVVDQTLLTTRWGFPLAALGV